MHKQDPNNLKPCWHMQTLVSAWVDGKLSGLTRWYTEQHIKGCPQCQSSLPFLRDLRFRLSSLGQRPVSREGLTDSQWEAVEKAWEQAEKQEKLTPHSTE